MQRPRFFLLDEVLPATDIPRMLCRVVTSKQHPLLASCAPSLTPTTAVPPHNPADILSSNNSFPPSPISSLNRRDFLTNTRGASIRATLTSLFGLDLSHTTTQRISIESEKVLRYSLTNPDEYFQVLMGNEFYARDVKALVKGVWKGEAFFVTGFLTTTGSTWRVQQEMKRGVALKAKVPISAAIAGGVPLPGLGVDPEFSPEAHDEVKAGSEMYIADEVIFAVAYSVVKNSICGFGEWKKGEPVFIEKVVVGPPVRSRRGEFAMGSKKDEIVEESSEDEGGDEYEVMVLENVGENEGGFEVDEF